MSSLFAQAFGNERGTDRDELRGPDVYDSAGWPENARPLRLTRSNGRVRDMNVAAFVKELGLAEAAELAGKLLRTLKPYRYDERRTFEVMEPVAMARQVEAAGLDTAAH